MPLTGSATITLPSGPGKEATALPLSGITKIEIDFYNGVIFFFQGNVRVSQFDYNEATTLTATITGSNTAIVVSSS